MVRWVNKYSVIARVTPRGNDLLVSPVDVSRSLLANSIASVLNMPHGKTGGVLRV